jgi:hypothetical protein
MTDIEEILRKKELSAREIARRRKLIIGINAQIGEMQAGVLFEEPGFPSAAPPVYNPVAALGSDLLGYWEANRSDLVTIATGASSWKDIVAAYDLAQVTAGAQPAYSATSFNGQPGLTFDGTDDSLLLASVPFPTVATPCEIWALIQQDALPANTTERRIFSYGGGGVGNYRSIQRVVVGGVNRVQMTIGDGAAAQTITGTNVDASSRHVIRAQFGATSSSLTVDGVAEGSFSVVPSTGNTRTRMGANSATTASLLMNGKIAALLVTKPLTTEATAVQTWLNARR